MFQSLNLQFRRIGVAFALLALATPIGALVNMRAGTEPALLLACAVAGGLFVVLTGLVVASCIVPALRGWRVAAEIGAASALAVSVASLLAPWLPGWARLSDFAVISGLLWALLYGPLAHRLPARLPQRDRARIHIALPHQMVWRMALPTRPSEHWDPLLRACVQDSEDADTFHLEYGRTGGGTDSVTITMLEIEPNRGYRYFFQGEASGVGRAFVQGDQSVLLVPDGEDATWVELSRSTEERLPGQVLLSWLDRAPADYARFLRDNAMGAEMSRTLAGLHRLAVLREELGRRRRKRPDDPKRRSSRLRALVRRSGSAASRMPAMLSW